MEFIVLTPVELKALMAEVLDGYVSRSPNSAPETGAKEIIDAKILCNRLNITEQTIIKWRKKGKIPFLVAGKSIRYDWQAVVKALEGGKKR